MKAAIIAVSLLTALIIGTACDSEQTGGPMKKVKFEIMGKKWTLRVMTREKYLEDNDPESDATTYMAKRRIDVSPDGMDIETVRHELVHAYFSELCTGSADLDRYAFEEVAAEMFAQRGPEILKQADSLAEKIK